MKIIVCIKQVPDTTEVRLDPKTGTLIRQGVPSIINPDDKSGLEAALRLKDSHGAYVTVLTMGPPQASAVLKQSYAMGADAVILLTDRKFGGADTWATSLTLAAAIKNLDYDLIITGRQAIDGDTAQVGPQIAEHLGIAQVSYVSEIEKAEEGLIVKRKFEDGYQKIKVKFPCLITALSELADPRFMTVGGVLGACRDLEIQTWGSGDIDIDPETIGLKGSPTKVHKSFTKGAKEPGRIVEGSAAELASAFVQTLKDRHLL